MKKKNRIKSAVTLALGFVLWAVGFYLYHYETTNHISEKTVESFEERLHQKEKKLHVNLRSFVSEADFTRPVSSIFESAKRFKEKNDLDLFVYKDNKLVVWTNNSIPLPLNDPEDFTREEVVHLKNGWYYIKRISNDNFDICGAFLIKQEFPYENKDLKNNFSSEISSNLNATLNHTPGKLNVRNEEGEFIFSIQPAEEYRPRPVVELIAFSCYLFALFILLQLLIASSQVILIKKPYLLVIFPLLIIIVRIVSIWQNWFGSFSKFELFNPELFASSALIPSLGDLIINLSIFFFLVNFLIKRTRNWFVNGNVKAKLIGFILPLFLISFFIAAQINDIIYALVYDSKINFDLEMLFDLDMYSLISVALIGFSFYTYFRFIQYIIIQVKKLNIEWNKLVMIWLVVSGLFFILDQLVYDWALLTSLWPIILSGGLLWYERKDRGYKFIHVISILAFVAFYSGYILETYSDDKEKEVRKIYAEGIAIDADPIIEFEYDLIQQQIKKDGFLERFLVDDFNETIFIDSIEDHYFHKMKNKYDLVFHLFGENKVKRSKPGTIPTTGYEKLGRIIQNSGIISSINPNIYFIKNNTDKLSYIINYPIENQGKAIGHMMVEMRSKKFPKEIGLPSVLLEDEDFSNVDLKNYSIAKYVDKNLVSHIGDYDYPFIPDFWQRYLNQFSNSDGYSHYVYSENDERITILSKKRSTVITSFTTFSYLLIYFGLILLIPLFFGYISENRIRLNSLSLNFKFQAVLVGLILLTLISFGIGAGTYVVQQYSLNSKSLIKEKSRSVETELQHKMGSESEISSDPSTLEYYLKKFSRVFVTDINLYDLNGSLLASSQPKIYSKGLISKKMNFEAYYMMDLKKRNEFIHKEKIGKLEYLSAYLPFVNTKGDLLAYLNIQYISKQDELENQISGFILAIVNIMVLMLAFSTFLAIILSNRLTSPLKYIQESLKSMKLGANNEPIYYEGNDEIGSLVQEYNQKVSELERYAAQLAKSERESAWREMAKQVAHEIKNPLTPMKLSIQHLNRSIKLADDDSEEKLKRVSSSLIEQIDALTRIANEFSNFAKMPKAQEEDINLTEILESTHAVFVEGDQDYILTFEDKTNSEPVIWADRNLCLRVFNNLIKNAIQSLRSEEEGRIKIILTEEKDRYVVEVRDNGIGIDDEAADKMFIPYFTTKSTGTGLGLAMSKQIIENMKGSIWFETELTKGTSFFVSFPKNNN